MKDKYTPSYPDPDKLSDIPNISGLSPRQNIYIEEAAQRAVAESEVWLLARRLNSVRGEYNRGDSRTELEALGFTILAEHDDLFYKVEAPAGWSKTTEGYWTTILDKEGNERISQFFKGARYDSRADLNIV